MQSDQKQISFCQPSNAWVKVIIAEGFIFLDQGPILSNFYSLGQIYKVKQKNNKLGFVRQV